MGERAHRISRRDPLTALTLSLLEGLGMAGVHNRPSLFLRGGRLEHLVAGLALWGFLGYRAMFPLPREGIAKNIGLISLGAYVLFPPIASLLYHLGFIEFANFLGGSSIRNSFALIVIFAFVVPVVGFVAKAIIEGGDRKLKLAVAKAFAAPMGMLIGLFIFGVQFEADRVSERAEMVPNLLVKYVILPAAHLIAEVLNRTFSG